MGGPLYGPWHEPNVTGLRYIYLGRTASRIIFKPLDTNNVRFGENILGTGSINDSRNTCLQLQTQSSGRPPFDVQLENFEYVSSKYSLDEICACLELRMVLEARF